MEAIPYGHRSNTERVRGPYAGYAVRAWTSHRSVPPVTVTRKDKGAICRLFHTSMERGQYASYDAQERTGHRSVPPVTVTRKGKGAI